MNISKKNKTGIIVTALVAGTLLLGGGYFAINGLPGRQVQNQVGAPASASVFQTYGDWYLKKLSQQKLTALPDQKDTHENITISVAEIWYDGMSLDFALKQHAPDGAKKFKQIKVSGTAGTEPDSVAANTIPIDSRNAAAIAHWGSPILHKEIRDQLPERFDLTVEVILEGSDEVWRMKVPVQLQASMNRTITYAVTKQYGPTAVTYKSVLLSPTATELLVELAQPSSQPLYPEDLSPRIQFMLEDDRGIVLRDLGGGTTTESRGNLTVYLQKSWFDPFSAAPKSIKIRAYTRQFNDNQEKTLLPIDHAPTVEQPIVVDRGEAGRIKITRIEFLPEKTLVYSRIEGAAPYTLTSGVEIVTESGEALGVIPGRRVVDPEAIAVVESLPAQPPETKLYLRYPKEAKKVKFIPELETVIPINGNTL